MHYSFKSSLLLSIRKAPEGCSGRRGHRDGRVLERAADEYIVAQGVSSDRMGIWGLINILLEGQIRFGWTGGMSGRDCRDNSLVCRGDMHAGAHGPYFVFLSEPAINPIDASLHTAYVVPKEEQRQFVYEVVADAFTKGLVTWHEALGALSKIITYQDYLEAPANIFLSKNRAQLQEFIASKRDDAELRLQTALAQRP